jgi:SAM-dependent methyltransferase
VYTHGHPEAALRSHRWRTVENSATYLIPSLTPGVSVLDIGCGPGNITADIARRVAPGPVVGLDSSAEVIALAVRDHEAPNLTFTVGDVYALDQPTGSVDVVTAHQVLHHLSDPVGAIVEMRRVCRPGGTIALREVDYAAMAWWPELPGLDRWLEMFRTVARANGGEPDAGRRVARWAREAGCDDLVASASTWCYANAEDRAWWSETWAQRTVQPPLGDRAVELGIATRQELDDCAQAWRQWGADPDAWFVTVHGEVIARP